MDSWINIFLKVLDIVVMCNVLVPSPVGGLLDKFTACLCQATFSVLKYIIVNES